jgi:tetratricopeptide (TPR) repeat protein
LLGAGDCVAPNKKNGGTAVRKFQIMARRVAVAVLWSISIATMGNAQTPLDDAFQEMSRNLTNPDKSLRYAQLAAQQGDIQGAIAALERLLLLNPNLDNIRLELGELYLRVGANELARINIDQALRSPSIPPAAQARAQLLLSESTRGAQRYQLSGVVFGGLRYDTNVNTGPASNQVNTPFGLATIQPQGAKKGDYSFYAGTSVRHLYDLGDQDQTVLETNLAAYTQTFISQRDFDIATLGVDIGPLFQLGEVPTRWGALRPYGTASYVAVGDTSYLVTGGGGLGYRIPTIGPLSGELRFQMQHETFYNSTFRPRNSEQTGTSKSVLANFQYAIDARSSAFLNFRYTRDDAVRSFQSNDDRDGTIGYSINFPAPFGTTTSAGWTATASVRYRDIVYDAPDPSVDAATARHDRRVEGTATLSIPIVGSLAAVLTGQVTRNSSNEPNFAFNNEMVSAGVSWNF